ncbi:MAG: formate dehydrogenase subunit gamma [Alphaproteobacteria bacterium]|nr:formate dehydrogenase subunit gamma [Alphaproteobacteria bacterium]
MNERSWNPERITEIVSAHAHLEGPLLPILHAVQAEFGFIPRDAIPVIAKGLNVTRAEVYGVVSFYHDFREQPAGRRVVKICRAEACQSMGGRTLAERVLKHFGTDWGGTSSDGAVTIGPVYCLGLCSVAPAALIDGEPHARLDMPTLVKAVEAKP